MESPAQRATVGINRYEETGPEGLVDRSRRPHTCSHATLEPIENAILVLRAKHPSWGARKLKARLEMLQPDVVWPAASTFGNILSRAGLTSPQKKRKRTTPCSEPFSLVTGPNQLWCMDFKGYFATGDGKRCDPLTITDAHSRYLIRCQIVSRIGFKPSPGDLRSSDAGVRDASANPNRQRRTVCGSWAVRTVEALAPMDETRNRA